MFNLFKTKSYKPKTLGKIGEEYAQAEYKKLGYKIIAQNEYNKKGKQLGEIDFIALSKTNIIFVEVKTRTVNSSKFGSGIEAVNFYKKNKLLMAVKSYLLRNIQYRNLIPQIDVIEVQYNKLDNSYKTGIIIPSAIEDFN
jgi:putative endonuclease